VVSDKLILKKSLKKLSEKEINSGILKNMIDELKSLSPAERNRLIDKLDVNKVRIDKQVIINFLITNGQLPPNTDMNALIKKGLVRLYAEFIQSPEFKPGQAFTTLFNKIYEDKKKLERIYILEMKDASLVGLPDDGCIPQTACFY